MKPRVALPPMGRLVLHWACVLAVAAVNRQGKDGMKKKTIRHADGKVMVDGKRWHPGASQCQ